MKKQSLRLLSILLVLATMMSVLACADKGSSESTESEQVTETEGEEVETELHDTLTFNDYDGYSFRILGEDMRDFNTVEAANGEVINDSVYNRNKLVEEKFNITLEPTIITWGEAASKIQQVCSAGEDAYDLLTASHQRMGSVITGGYVLNWNDVEGMNFDAPYYVQEANENFAIGDNMMLLFGDYLESNIRCCFAIAYNKQLAEQYNIPNMYEIVDSGSWTVDKLIELTKSVYSDVNGNGKSDKTDFYGFITDSYAMIDSFCRTLGLSAISKDENNYPYLDFYNETTVDAYSLLYKLYYESDGTYVNKEAFAHVESMFPENQCVFTDLMIIHLESEAFRSMTDDYGVLPYPKRTEEQEMSYTHMDGTFSCMMLPVTLSSEQIERTALVTEALNCYGYEMVTPALYEIALKNKLTRDEDSWRMLDLVLAGRRFSFDSLDEVGFSLSPYNALRNQLSAKKNDIASYYASNEQSARNWIESMIEAYEASQNN